MAQPKILVVEDNPVIAGMIRRFLTKSDYGITAIVTTGEEAVELAGKSIPDLTLMDVQLAGEMDGITAARLIGEKFHIPTIYLTGSSDAETIARAASTEAYGYLLKPVQERDLIKTVEAALSKHASECRVREHQSWLWKAKRAAFSQSIARLHQITSSDGCLLLSPVFRSMSLHRGAPGGTWGAPGGHLGGIWGASALAAPDSCNIPSRRAGRRDIRVLFE